MHIPDIEPDPRNSVELVNVLGRKKLAQHSTITNGSIVEWGNRYLLVSREVRNSWGPRTNIIVSWLDENLEIESCRLLMERAEDPRAFVYKNELHVMYHRFSNGYSTRLAKLDDNLNVTEDVSLEAPPGDKNWTVLPTDDKLYVMPWIDPYGLCELSNGSPKLVYKTTVASPWDTESYGRICGGTPAIKMDESYVSFFHSHTGGDRRYFAGAILLEGSFPFHPTHVAGPLDVPVNVENTVSRHYHHIIFPCGIVRESDESVLVSAGCQDSCVIIMRVDINKLNWVPYPS